MIIHLMLHVYRQRLKRKQSLPGLTGFNDWLVVNTREKSILEMRLRRRRIPHRGMMLMAGGIIANRKFGWVKLLFYLFIFFFLFYFFSSNECQSSSSRKTVQYAR